MAEGGEINVRIFNEDGYDEDGYDEDGLDEDGLDKDKEEGYKKDGYNIYGFDRYGYDRDGKVFEQGEGEHIPLKPRTSTSSGRETQRPFKPPRVRTSTRKEKSFANPSFNVGNDVEETTKNIEKMLNLEKLRKKLEKESLAEVKGHYPRMRKDVLVGQKKGKLAVKMLGDKDWSTIYNLDGKLSIQHNKDLKKALGFNREDIMKANNEQNLDDQARIVELEKDLDREDISEEVRNTTINEINGLKEGIDERNKENEAIQNLLNWKERIKEIFKKYGFTITSVVTAAGIIIGVIVSNLSSGLSNMAKGVSGGLKDIGNKLAQILPGMIGAIASFIFKTAGQVVGFLAKNAWILVVAVVVYLVESLKKKRTR